MKNRRDSKKKIITEKNQSSINQSPEKDNNSNSEIKTNTEVPEKKAPKWFYVILILIPLLFLVFLEFFLRAIDYGYNFEQWVDAGQEKFIINPDIGRKYFTGSNFNPNTIEDVFDQHKKENSFRIFVLGGSSAQGFPYNPMGSFSRYIKKRLEIVYPDTRIEVVNISMTAVNSYTVLDLLPGVLKQKPDLILIYAGHNEYYGALGVASVQSFGSSRALIKMMLYLNDFKITQLVRNSIAWVTSLFASDNNEPSGTMMSRMAKEQHILLDSEEFNSGIQQFKDNLSDILQKVNDRGVPIILGRVVSNLKDQKPFISVDTPGNKSADQVFEEAEKEFNNKNFIKADSLFRLAKELDALRFRAPQKINEVIDQLGKEFQVAIAPIDLIFDSVSPGGVVGNNLIVDHLHPNVEGYQLIGKAFYEVMEKQRYLPKTENAKISFYRQDSLTKANFVFTKFDSVLGNYHIKLLKTDWPYVKQRAAISEFKQEDFAKLFQPKDIIDSLAMIRIENKVSWVDAHLIAATYYLRNDNVKEYLKYMNVLIDQYPFLMDLDGALRFFYDQKKINLDDYTPKRNGLLAMCIGNYDNAIRHLNEALKSNQEDPVVLYNLALAHSNKKDFNTALTTINKCLTVNPQYPEAKSLKQQILNQVNN